MNTANEPAFPESKIHHKSGGFEQAILQVVLETQGLSDRDQQRLKDLKKQDQFYRTEIRIPERSMRQGHPHDIINELNKTEGK